MFSVATNFDDDLPGRLVGMDVDEVFGSCDQAPIGHGRPHAIVPPVSWRALERHVRVCRNAELGFNLLLNPLCLGGREENLRLERKLRRTLSRAEDMGVTAVTVAHPWLVSLARETRLKIRVGVFVGAATVEQVRVWENLGAHGIVLDTHVLSRDLATLERIARASHISIEIPVNIGCLLRCPLARIHVARLSHSSRPGTQPMDPCARWCQEQKRRDPINVVRADFVRPEDLDRYRSLGISRFKIVDRACSTDVLVERVRAYYKRRWDGDLLQLLGPRGTPPRRRGLPVIDGLWHLGLRGAWRMLRQARQFMKLELPWSVDNRALEGLLLPAGCQATGCEECGHCARMAALAVRMRPTDG
jgi:collagenase-like PrtC family protease